jgi:hypothetical protein
MSVALQSLASAAAATIYGAIGVAETGAELDDIAKLVWRGNLDCTIDDADAQHLVQYIEQRRPLHRRRPQQITFPGFPIPEPNLKRVTSIRHRSRFAPRREQRSPDKQASYDRRHRLAYSGVLPRHLAPRLTIGEMAVIRVVCDEYVRAGGCELSLAAIAARSGVCRKTAKRATQKAQDERLISIEERPVRGQRHKPNLIRIISFEWLKWLRRSKEKANEAKEVAGGGGHFVPPTDTTLTDDGGGVVELKKTEPPPETARPQGGQPTKEAVAFADELANIAGYKLGSTPDSWRNANPPQVVQVWLNELDKYDIERRPIEILRVVATGVMQRKRGQDASPPHSPRYFGPEIFKLVGGLERARQEILKIQQSKAMRDRSTKRVA